MLWKITKPPTSGLYWLDQVHDSFYKKLFVGEVFANCFDTSFNPILVGSAKTNELFQAVYDNYGQLDEPTKVAFQSLYNNHLAFKNFFADSNLAISRPSADFNDLWEAAKKLGGYLYTTTLDLACFKNAANNNPSMDQHYEEFRQLNGIVCCFCGTEEMMEEREIVADKEVLTDEEKQWRASYDHYLPKKHYPFLAVDFDNLIPCCQKCNEKAKGEKDFLVLDGNRQLAFNPYVDPVGVSLVANYDCKGVKNFMRVSIKNTNCDLEEKAKTWNDTFAVLDRVNHRLKRFDASWLAPTLNGCADLIGAREALESEAARCNSECKEEREAYFKSLCFYEVNNKTDDQIIDLLTAVGQIYANRAI